MPREANDNVRREARPLRQLERRLRAARRRWFLSGLVTGLSLTAACVAVLALALRVSDPGFGFDAAALAAVVAGVGLGLSVFVAWRRMPSRGGAVRRADVRFGTKAQLSTALEWLDVPTSTTAERVLRDALVSDAERLTSRVNPRTLAPLTFRPPHGIAAAVTVVAFLGIGIVGSVQTQPEIPTDAQGRGAIELDKAQRETLAEELVRLADVLQADREDSDEYLRALVATSRDLAEEVRSGAVGAAAAGDRLEQLLTHVGEALGPRFVPTSPRADAPLELKGLPMPDRPPVADRGTSSSRMSDPGDLAARVQSLRERVEEVRSRRADSPYGAVFRPEGAAAAATSVEDQRTQAVTDGERAGAPTGTARRSTDAPGDAAGAGTADLASGRPDEASAFTDRQDVHLPSAKADPGGARVRAAGEPADGETTDAAGAGASVRAGGEVEAALPAAPAPAEPNSRDEQGGWRKTSLTPGARQLAARLLAPEAPPFP